MGKRQLNLFSVVVPVATERGPFNNLIKWLPVGLNNGLQVVVVLDKTKNIVDPELIRVLDQNRGESLIVVEGQYGSPGSARNAGMKSTTGKWIMFWDCDDNPNILACLKMVVEADEIDAKFAIGGFSWESAEPNRPQSNHCAKTEPAELLQSIGRNPGIWRFAWSRELIKSEFSNLQMAEDQVFILENCDFDANYFVSQSLVYTYLSGAGIRQTSIKKFMMDLSASMLATSRHISESAGLAKSQLAGVFLVKQFISAIKHGTLRTRVAVFLTLLKILRGFRWSDSMQILRAFVQVIKKQRSHGRDVTIALTGGLGNQLFQLAAALNVSNHNKVYLETSIGKPRLNEMGRAELTSFNLPIGVESLNSKKSNWLLRKSSGFMLRNGVNPRGFENSKIASTVLKTFWTLIVRISYRSRMTPIAGQGVGFFGMPQVRGNVLLYGYFQSFRWADSVYQRLMALTPSFGVQEIMKFTDLAQIEKPLVVHIRLGDYKNEPNFGLASKSYYEFAVKKLWESNVFNKIWVFSDEPELAATYFPQEFLSHLRWIPEILGSAALTLEVMRLGHGYVIGNSTYSWWGAYLSRSHNPPVIAPDPWFANLVDPIDLIPLRWNRMKYSNLEKN
jgi:hypothetical protein